MNPIEELLRGMMAQPAPRPMQKPTWMDKFAARVEQLEPEDEAMLIVCSGGKTRIVKSPNVKAEDILTRAAYACGKLNIK